MHPRLIKTKEELLGHATSDDEEDDEIGDLIEDTFSYFTEKHSEENLLNQASWGRDMELNKKIRAIYRRLSNIFSGTLPKNPALLPPFLIEIDRTRWEVSQT